MRNLTCPPELEVLGVNLVAFSNNIQGAETTPIMQKYGIIDINPEAWYPARNLLDALNELAVKTNVAANLTAIGMRIGEMVPMPPGLENATLEQAIGVWDAAYQYLHRGADAGCIQVEKVSDTYFKTIHSVIYPDDMSYGILYSYGRRFLPPRTHFSVFYDPDVKARDYGGDGPASIISIKWD
ncbi:MAG: hypothetical protein K8I30_22300 [Anaerolineae bacterium]|nr:hypothetical protein [Anaerolineae bacterium]